MYLIMYAIHYSVMIVVMCLSCQASNKMSWNNRNSSAKLGIDTYLIIKKKIGKEQIQSSDKDINILATDRLDHDVKREMIAGMNCHLE